MHPIADAARTPSGPPPIPKKISTPYLSFVTKRAPETSPSVINFKFTFKFLSSSNNFFVSWTIQYTSS